MAGIPRRHNAVKEIHAPGDRLDDVAGRPHAHEVAGLVHRHVLLHGLDDVVHLLRGLPYRKAADGVAGEVKLGNAFHVIHPDVRICAALIDAPEHLLGVHRVRQGVQTGIFRLAAHQPAVGSVHAFLNIVPGRGVFNALVKGHAHVAAQIGLDLHTLLRPHENLVAVDVGGKIHALLLDFPQGSQTEHLKSAGIRQNGAVPSHELMQSPHLAHHRVRGTQMQMVGIGQLHLTPDVFQILGAQCAFNRALRADVHEHRCLDGAVGTGEFSPAGFALGFFQFKHGCFSLSIGFIGLYRTYIFPGSSTPRAVGVTTFFRNRKPHFSTTRRERSFLSK